MIKNVKINPGCVSCGTCEVVCPNVFEVKEIVEIRKNADLRVNEEGIKEAAQTCPVGAIEIEEE